MYENESDRTNKINKARKDVFDALKSLDDLSDNDRINLMKEFMGAELFAQFMMQMKKWVMKELMRWQN